MITNETSRSWRTRLGEKDWYKWFALGLLFFVLAVNYGDRTALSSILPLLRRDLGLSDLGLAAIGTVFVWSYALVSPFSGLIGDRFSRRSIVIWSLVSWSAVTALTAFVSNGPQLLLMRLLLGISESFYLPSATALLGEYHSGRTRALAMGIHVAGCYLGMVVGGTYSGYLGEHYGWRPTIFALGASGIVLAIICWAFLVSSPKTSASTLQPARSTSSLPPLQAISYLMKLPTYLVIVGQAMLVSIGTWIFSNWLPLYFKETFDLTLAQAGFAGTIGITVGAIIGLLMGGWLSDRVARKAAANRMLLQILFHLASIPFLFAFVVSNSLTVIAVSIFCFSLLKTMGLANESPLLCEVVPPKLWSTAIGLMNTGNNLAAGLGILAAGGLKSSLGLGTVFAGISGITALAAILLTVGYLVLIQKDLARRAQQLELNVDLAG